jgi:hypothetical protein
MISVFDERNLLYVGLGVCISAITYLSLSQRQKEVVFRRLTLRGRRSSSADTPPRSLSPEKEPANSQPKSSEYVNTFPPLSRENLPQAAADLPEARRKLLETSKLDKDWTKSVLEFEDDFRKAEANKYVYTGYKIEEIRALGNFPNYAALSDTPLPEPYHEHDITKALPRPYRPFRWAYHQTMCKWFLFEAMSATPSTHYP